jgi:hypothetical protein
MANLYFTELGNHSHYTTTGAVSGAYAGGSDPNSTLDNVGPFVNFQSNYYWSGSEYAPNPFSAWYFRTNFGDQNDYFKSNSLNALVVRPGDVAAVPEADTWAMLLAGLGLVGAATRRRRGRFDIIFWRIAPNQTGKASDAWRAMKNPPAHNTRRRNPMNIPKTALAALALYASLISGAAHALPGIDPGIDPIDPGLEINPNPVPQLLGRDLDGNPATYEAYYDNILDITWLADANYAKTSGIGRPGVPVPDGIMDWTRANAWIANLSFTDGVNIYDDWRLPTVEPINGSTFNTTLSYDGSTEWGFNITSPRSELAHLFYVTLGNKGQYGTTGINRGCDVSYPDNTCLDNAGPFSNLLEDPRIFWTATSYDQNPEYAWGFAMHSGYQAAVQKDYIGLAWAVHDGDIRVTAVPEADTWMLLLAGLGLVGAAVKRRHGKISA